MPYVARYERKDRIEPSAAANLVVVFSNALYAPPFTLSAVTTSPKTYRRPSSSVLTTSSVTGANWPACTKNGENEHETWAHGRENEREPTTATEPPAVYSTLARRSFPEMATDRNKPIFS